MNTIIPYKFCILMNEDNDSHKEWENACIKYKVRYDVVDLTSDKWYEEATRKDYDCYLLRPPGRLSVYKQMYDERIYIICKLLSKKLYPSYEEVILHENKKMMAYWLKAKNTPHIETHIFYKKEESIEYVNSIRYPIVGKTSIGSSGEGVVFLNNRREASDYVRRAFADGITRRFGPGLRQGSYFKRGIRWIFNPKFAINKIRGYRVSSDEIQRFFVIFQKYIEHEYEWRTVKIGDSYFAHKKTKSGMMCSGSKGIEYVNPPLELLDFTRKICEENRFNCMSIDILEDGKNNYVVNELQCIFGHVQDHILEVDGKPGRYKYENNNWVFENGNFNLNLSFDLRLQNVIEMLNGRK